MTDQTPKQPQNEKKRSDAEEAIRFMVIKAAIFILIPAIAAGIAAYMILR